MFTQTTNPKNKNNLNSGSNVIIVVNPITVFETAFENDEKMKKENGKLWFLIEIASKNI